MEQKDCLKEQHKCVLCASYQYIQREKWDKTNKEHIKITSDDLKGEKHE